MLMPLFCALVKSYIKADTNIISEGSELNVLV